LVEIARFLRQKDENGAILYNFLTDNILLTTEGKMFIKYLANYLHIRIENTTFEL
jgi:hypothetical protein